MRVAESTLDSALDCHESANTDSRNDEFVRDSSPTAQNDNTKKAQNDNLKGFAESSLDSADFTPSKHKANSSIFDESQRVASGAKQKSGLRSHERGNRTDESIDEASGKLPDLSQKDAEFANIFSIYLLFLSAFFFATKSLSSRARFCALPCFVALISIPFIFMLWDYYSIVKLFYSLFGGTSVFCALLCIRYILIEILQDKLPRRFCEYARNNKSFRDSSLRKCSAQNDKCVVDSSLALLYRNDNVKNLAPLIALFSIPLFLGHLDLISVDILRSEIASAIFASTFIVALFWADIVAFLLALIAVIIDRDFMFALFDGYLLIFSVIYCVIWAIKWSFKKIIARA